MDDFLHNLRSGKLKQPDRSNRSYNDQQYKGGQRRPMMDRRKKEYDNKESIEHLAGLKDVLENLANSQKRIAEAFDARNKTEERKANAMEALAKNIYRILNPKADDTDSADLQLTPDTPDTPDTTSDAHQSRTSQPIEEEDPKEKTASPAAEDLPSAETDKNAGEPARSILSKKMEKTEKSHSPKKQSKLTIIDQQTLFPVISRMRAKGESWERIARHISDQDYPTLSGKGIWRGVMVKNLFEKMSS